MAAASSTWPGVPPTSSTAAPLASTSSASTAAAAAAVQALAQVDVDDLMAGTREWANLQPVLRRTFKALVEATRTQQAEQLRLGEELRRQAQRLEEGAGHEHAQGVSARTLRALLEGEVAALRAELGPRLGRLEARVDELAAEQKALAVQQQQRAPPAAGAGGDGEAVLLALTRRVELLQGELVRLARALDAKADGAEVEAALRQRVSKASLPKRVEALLDERPPQPPPPTSSEELGQLRAKVEEQEAAVRKALREVEAIRTHVLGGGGGGGSGGSGGGDGEGAEAASPPSLVEALRAVQSLLQTQGRRVHKAEKEVQALHDRVVHDIALVEGKVEERLRQQLQQQQQQQQEGEGGGGGGAAGGQQPLPLLQLEESLKAFEQEVYKELDARDGELRRQVEGTLGAVRELEAKVHQNEALLAERLEKVEDAATGAAAALPSLAQRVDRLELDQRQLQQQAAAAVRPSSRGSLGSAGSVGGGGGGGMRAPVVPPPPLNTAALLGATDEAPEPETPDPARRDTNIRHVFTGPPASQSQQQHQQMSQPHASRRGSFPASAAVAAAAQAAQSQHQQQQYPQGGQQQQQFEEEQQQQQHQGGGVFFALGSSTGGVPPTASQLQQQQGHAQQQHHHHQTYQPPTPTDGGSTFRSFVSGGGMPTVWRGTALSLGYTADSPGRQGLTMGGGDSTTLDLGLSGGVGGGGGGGGGVGERLLLSASAGSAPPSVSREQLEALRREKQLLRARIREGLLSLSQTEGGGGGVGAAGSLTTGAIGGGGGGGSGEGADGTGGGGGVDVRSATSMV